MSDVKPASSPVDSPRRRHTRPSSGTKPSATPSAPAATTRLRKLPQQHLGSAVFSCLVVLARIAAATVTLVLRVAGISLAPVQAYLQASLHQLDRFRPRPHHAMSDTESYASANESDPLVRRYPRSSRSSRSSRASTHTSRTSRTHRLARSASASALVDPLQQHPIHVHHHHIHHRQATVARNHRSSLPDGRRRQIGLRLLPSSDDPNEYALDTDSDDSSSEE